MTDSPGIPQPVASTDSDEFLYDDAIDCFDYECECCEDRGCDLCDPLHYDTHALKWIAEGLETLDEVVAAAEAQAAYLQERLGTGWVLTSPVDSGYVHMHLPVSEGEKP